MPVSRAFCRLLRIRELEEDQSRIVLEEARGELGRLEALEQAARSRAQRGRHLVASSAGSQDTIDRIAGVEEILAARRAVEVLRPRLAEARWKLAERQTEFLACRAHLLQIETLIEEAKARDAVDAGRKSQQALDDWFCHRPSIRTAAGKDDPSSQSDSIADTNPATVIRTTRKT